MKKTVLVLIAITMLLFLGCSDRSQESAEFSTPTPEPTHEPTAKPTPTASPVPTTIVPPTPIPTTTPMSTPQPQGYVFVADGFCYYELTGELKERITGMSYPQEGSDIVSFDDLRYIELLHYNFDGEVKYGELIVSEQVAQE